MADVIESIAKLLPFDSWGVKKEIAEPLSIIILTGIAFVGGWLIKDLIKRIKARNAAIDAIMPQFDWHSIIQARKHYIATQYQNASPSRQEEPGFTHLYIARSKLIPFFIKGAFNQRLESERFYLVLGDSGMGKTTFLINLYLQYHRLFNQHRHLKMRLYRMSDPRTLKIIAGISEEVAKNTILLLDGLDEDSLIYPTDSSITADEAFRRRVDEIISNTNNFPIVVMTCRTQYFPGQEDDPYELRIRRSDEKGFYQLNKLYISPFTMKEVRLFLRKKYGWLFINLAKRKRAESIITQASKLVMRPMLLSYIDYLLQEEKTYPNVLTIYEAMVRNWLIREATKRKNKAGEVLFRSNLEKLSLVLAVELYKTWRIEHRLWLTREETIGIANRFNIQLSPHEITGQSLLTCDGSGNWKFAHRSIMEYFLARQLELHPEFLAGFSFDGQDMVATFYNQTENPFFHLHNKVDLSSRDFYIQTKLVFVDNFQEIKNRFYKHGLFSIFSLEEAMEYCNKRNVLAGYPQAYDVPGQQLIDKRQKGFRLPLPDEMEVADKLLGNVFESKEVENVMLDMESTEQIFDMGRWATSPDDNYVYIFAAKIPQEPGTYSIGHLILLSTFSPERRIFASIQLVLIP